MDSLPFLTKLLLQNTRSTNRVLCSVHCMRFYEKFYSKHCNDVTITILSYKMTDLDIISIIFVGIIAKTQHFEKKNGS